VDTNYIKPSYISEFHLKEESKVGFKPMQHPLTANDVHDLGPKNASFEKQKLIFEPKSGGDSPRLGASNSSSHGDQTISNYTESP